MFKNCFCQVDGGFRDGHMDRKQHTSHIPGRGRYDILEIEESSWGVQIVVGRRTSIFRLSMEKKT